MAEIDTDAENKWEGAGMNWQAGLAREHDCVYDG